MVFQSLKIKIYLKLIDLIYNRSFHKIKWLEIRNATLTFPNSLSLSPCFREKGGQNKSEKSLFSLKKGSFWGCQKYGKGYDFEMPEHGCVPT